MKKSSTIFALWLLAQSLLFSQSQPADTLNLDCDSNSVLKAGDVRVVKKQMKYFLQITDGLCPPDSTLKIEYKKVKGWEIATDNLIKVGTEDIPVKVSCGDKTIFELLLAVTPPPHGGEAKKRPTRAASLSGEGEKEPQHTRKQPIEAAILLDKMWKNEQYNDVWHLLEAQGFEKSDLEAIIYLQFYKDKLTGVPPIPKAEAEVLPGDTPLGTPLLNILNPTTAIDALGRLAVKRFKQELTVAYLDRFRDTLNAHEKTLGLLMPGTFQVLQQQDFFNFSALLTSLRENALSDVQAFPRNGQAYIRSIKSEIEAKNKDVYPVLMSAFDLAEAVRTALPASEAVELLGGRDYAAANDRAYPKMLRVLGLFSRNLHTFGDKATTSGWATSDDLAYLLSHPNAFNFWMAMLLKYEKEALEGITLDSSGNLYRLLNLQNEGGWTAKTREMLFHFHRTASAANALKFSDNDSLQARALGELALALTDLTAGCTEVLLPDNTKINQFTKILRAAGLLEQGIRTKQYGLALTRLVELLDEASKAIYGAGKSPAWLVQLNKYGNALVTLLQARNSEQLADALDAVVLPVQSYQLKRQPGHFSVSLNMYAGGAIGLEWAQEGTNLTAGFLLAPTVPVGIGLNWGTKDIGSFSLFMPVIDVGAVAAFRFQDNTSALPELAWRNVLAPGFYAAFGFKDSPLTLSIGGQLGPELRKVNQIEERQFRFGLTLMADIPLFNLKN